MPAPIQILQIGPASDGTGATPVSSVGMRRNDAYFLKKIAEEWAKDRRLPTGLDYQLDQLPAGFGGFERDRENNSKHTDRYFYGHPSGIFRSIRELYPHFKHLQDHSTSQGCNCKLCVGATRRASDLTASRRSNDLGASSSASNPRQKPIVVPTANTLTISSSNKKPKTFPKGSLLRLSSESPTPKRKQVDELGTPDVYRKLLDKLKAAGSDGVIDEPIVDSMSPHWRVGHNLLMHCLDGLRTLPNYVPRCGELVVFLRSTPTDGTLSWDKNRQTLCWTINGDWLENPKWEVGVIVEMPTEAIETADLSPNMEAKKQSINYSGFRIEPLSDPNSDDKSFTYRHIYVPLHVIRPLCFWPQCFGVNIQDCHPTLRHALAVASSFCIVGKYQFKGTWPDATVFARGVYLGAELIMVGDAVRLLPRAGYQAEHTITDVMVVTSIRLRFVNLAAASDDDYDDERAYTTCLHISGRPFTLDSTRSFDGIGKLPANSETPFFPASLQDYGVWFSVLDPLNSTLRLEVPYTRVAGRCYDRVALKSWFPSDLTQSTASFVAVNTPQSLGNANTAQLSQGLLGLQEARRYSLDHDGRIHKAGGKSWFWADSRTEQLDLHEVNGQFVGVKDPNRTKKHSDVLRNALKLLDGNGSFEEYLSERNRSKSLQHKSDHEERVEPASSSWGLMAGTAPNPDAESSSSSSSSEDAMEVDMETGGTPYAHHNVNEERNVGSHGDGDDDDDGMDED